MNSANPNPDGLVIPDILPLTEYCDGHARNAGIGSPATQNSADDAVLQSDRDPAPGAFPSPPTYDAAPFSSQQIPQ